MRGLVLVGSVLLLVLASAACARPSEVVSTDAPSEALPDNGPTAVFVVGDAASLNESERMVQSRLQAHHDLSVQVVDDDDVTAAHADGAAAILISKTGESVNTGSMFRTTATPVIFWEDNLQRSDFLGTAHDDGSSSTAWHSTGRHIEIVAAAGEERTGGLAGDIALLDTEAQEVVHSPAGALIDDATVVSRWPGDPDRVTTYTVEAGDVLAQGDRAAGRRVFLPFYDDTFRSITPDGMRLFDSLIGWALGA